MREDIFPRGQRMKDSFFRIASVFPGKERLFSTDSSLPYKDGDGVSDDSTYEWKYLDSRYFHSYVESSE